MLINADILCDILKEKYQIKHYGHGIGSQILTLPVFYERGAPLIKGRVYITRTHDLPSSPEVECLFICIGNAPTNIWSNWRGEVLHIADSSIDILTVFNATQEIFDKLVNWECGMQVLLENNADIEEMLKASIPIFENRVTITDYELRIIAYCEAEEGQAGLEVKMCRAFDRVPNEKSMLFENVHQGYKQHREPYIYKEYGKDNYCINFYIGDRYMGTCSLMEDYRPIRDSDHVLFQRFAYFIRRALAIQSRALASQFVSLKAIFSELLQSLPVSRSDLHRALSIFRRNTTTHDSEYYQWLCIVVRSANKGKTLPEGYLCTALEEMLPGCTAIAHDGVIAAFCMFKSNTITVGDFRLMLEPYLRDMNFLAGVSLPFTSIYKARSYFLQADCALETGFGAEQNQVVFDFGDYALTYMLRHSVGQFEPELVIPSGLRELREYSGGVDYWDTLKRYLDNECNASQTAKDMFLHRSSLFPRLEKLKTFVDMDTPEQRLYLRMCVYLIDLLDIKGKNDD